MKQAAQAIPLAMLMAACSAIAQAVTVTSNPADSGVVTSYYSICPTQTTTTITVSTTTTICPGPNCGAAEPTFMVTTVGPDGKTTVAEILPYTAPCPCDGGVCDAVYTITRPCPCTGGGALTMVPEGFTSAAVPCDVCAQNGGPFTVTVVTPVPSGPYASQTPSMGAPYNGASASAGASAYASAGPNGAVATAGNGYASAGAGSGAAAWASNNTVAGASSLPIPSSTMSMVYNGSANRAVYAASAIAAAIVGSMAVLL